LAALFRQSIYSRMAGYEDVNDVERFSRDPTFHLMGSEKIWDRGAAPAQVRFPGEGLRPEGALLSGIAPGVYSLRRIGWKSVINVCLRTAN
jgi:hypothetical protein